ncbi:hypothetical protein KSS87_003854 [Heliosperma pusillum]|nr:hypothetical protein KSS87_003854 [Heliosperma pusillum]
MNQSIERKRMSEMMTTATTNPSNESTESNRSRRDSTTSNSDLSDNGAHGSSSSPPLKRPRLPTIIDGIDITNMSDDEYIDWFISLAMPDSSQPKVNYDELRNRDKTYAKLVLAYYKENTGNDYELTRIRSMLPFPPRQGSSQGGTHLNFFAHPTGYDEPEYLFYGELQHRPIDPQVVDCYVFPLGTHAGIDFILHPPHIVCPDCDAIGRYELPDDDDYL